MIIAVDGVIKQQHKETKRYEENSTKSKRNAFFTLNSTFPFKIVCIFVPVYSDDSDKIQQRDVFIPIQNNHDEAVSNSLNGQQVC